MRFGDELARLLERVSAGERLVPGDYEMLRLSANATEATAGARPFLAHGLVVDGGAEFNGVVLIGNDTASSANLYWTGAELQFRTGRIVVASLAAAGGLASSGCRVRRSTNMSTADETWTTFTWDVEEYDDDSYWDSGDATKLVIPRDGRYSFGFYVQGAIAAANYVAVRILKNSEASGEVVDSRHVNTLGYAGSASIDSDLVTGDYLRLQIWTEAAESNSVTAGNNCPSFWIRRER